MPSTLNAPAPTPAPTRDGPAPRRTLRVLVADADPAARECYQKALPAFGHQVCLAESARQAVDLCRAAAPDLVIVDARLPDATGLELAAAVCRERPVPVVLAASAPDAAALWAADGHVLGVLPKPVTADVLAATVAAAARAFEAVAALRAEAAQLRQALEDRKMIERAKGLLMRFAGLTEADAYRRMRGQATRGGRKVVDVAREVVAAGDVFGTLAEDGPSADGPPRHPRHAVSHANGNGNGV